MNDLHIFLSKNCDKAQVSAAVTALTAAMKPTSADDCNERIFRLMADVLYEQQLKEANKSNFINVTWPAVKTCKDPYAIRTPSEKTMQNRRDSVHKICKHTSIDVNQWPLQLPSAEHIASVTRSVYTIESTLVLRLLVVVERASARDARRLWKHGRSGRSWKRFVTLQR